MKFQTIFSINVLLVLQLLISDVEARVVDNIVPTYAFKLTKHMRDGM